MLSRSIYIISLLFVFTLDVSAGNIVLSNGDTITGEITKMKKDKLFVKTRAMGEIGIERKYIETFSTDKYIEVHTSEGEKLLGMIEKDRNGMVRVVAKDSDTIESVFIKNINVLGKLPDPVQWEFRLNAGLSGAEGNSELFNLNFGSYIKRRAERSRLTFDGQYLFEEDDGDKSKDEWYTDVKYDYFFTKKVYGFSTVRAQRDEIADLDLRLSLSPGVGYQWYESKELNFSTEIGPAFLYENFSNGDDDNREITGRLAYFFDKLVFNRLSVFHNTKFFPKITDPTDLYLTTSAGFRSNITETMFTEARVTVEHDTTPADDAEETDIYYTLGLGVSF